MVACFILEKRESVTSLSPDFNSRTSSPRAEQKGRPVYRSGLRGVLQKNRLLDGLEYRRIGDLDGVTVTDDQAGHFTLHLGGNRRIGRRAQQ